MAKTQSVAAALPGDVIQITAPGPAQLALMIVEECRRTFTRARMAGVQPDGSIGWIEYRVEPGTYEVVGCARAVSAETAKARQIMTQTLKQQGED